MIKRLKIVAALLFSILSTIYFTLVVLSFLLLYDLPSPFGGLRFLIEDELIAGIVFSATFIMSLICSISCIWFLCKDHVKFIFTLPIYLFLPLGIPYFLIIRKLNKHDEFYVTYSHAFSQFLLFTTSIISYLFSMIPLSLSITLWEGVWYTPMLLFYAIPAAMLTLAILIGTTANLIENWSGNKIASGMAYMGFTFVWIHKFYKMSLLKHDLYEVSYKKTSL